MTTVSRTDYSAARMRADRRELRRAAWKRQMTALRVIAVAEGALLFVVLLRMMVAGATVVSVLVLAALALLLVVLTRLVALEQRRGDEQALRPVRRRAAL